MILTGLAVGAVLGIFLQKTWRSLVALFIVTSVHAVGIAALAVIGGGASGTWFSSAEGLIGSWIALIFYGLPAAVGRNFGLGIAGPTGALFNFTVTGDVERIDWGVMLVLGLLIGAFAAAKATG